MDYDAWEPYYRRILSDFGYDPLMDVEGARLLDSLLGASGEGDALHTLSTRLSGKRVVVAGGALKPETPVPEGPVLATGSSVSVLLDGGVTPCAVVTDLDKDVDAQVEACRRGAVPVIHAHGDNMELMREHVASFPGPVLGTCQCRPLGRLENFGGFTDGDRAVFLAKEAGASGCLLVGFDFTGASGVKATKLKWAARLLALHGDFVRSVP